MRSGIALVASLFVCASSVAAQQPELPAVATNGLSLLEAGQCDSAFSYWASSWTGPTEAGKREQLMAGCALLNQFGVPVGHDVIRVVEVTPHLVRGYVMVRYASQPVYLMLVAYRADSAWKVTSINWHTAYDKVVPSSIFGPERPGP